VRGGRQPLTGVPLRASVPRTLSVDSTSTSTAGCGWGVGEELRREVGHALLEGVSRGVRMPLPVAPAGGGASPGGSVVSPSGPLDERAWGWGGARVGVWGCGAHLHCAAVALCRRGGGGVRVGGGALLPCGKWLARVRVRALLWGHVGGLREVALPGWGGVLQCLCVHVREVQRTPSPPP
jgi:hypothetical protein